MKRIGFELWFGFGAVAVVVLVLLGFHLWQPIQINWYEGKLRHADLAERVRAVDALIGLGDAGK